MSKELATDWDFGWDSAACIYRAESANYNTRLLGQVVTLSDFCDSDRALLARRIVAALNFTKGMPTEEIERLAATVNHVL